jgi:hypothetical protein
MKKSIHFPLIAVIAFAIFMQGCSKEMPLAPEASDDPQAAFDVGPPSCVVRIDQAEGDTPHPLTLITPCASEIFPIVNLAGSATAPQTQGGQQYGNVTALFYPEAEAKWLSVSAGPGWYLRAYWLYTGDLNNAPSLNGSLLPNQFPHHDHFAGRSGTTIDFTCLPIPDNGCEDYILMLEQHRLNFFNQPINITTTFAGLNPIPNSNGFSFEFCVEGCDLPLSADIYRTCSFVVLGDAGTAIANNSVTLIGLPTGGTSPFTYAWSTGETTQTIEPHPAIPTDYTVTITDGDGGTSMATTHIGTVAIDICTLIFRGVPSRECTTVSWVENGIDAPSPVFSGITGPVFPGPTSNSRIVCPDENTILSLAFDDNNSNCHRSIDFAFEIIDVRCGNNLQKIQFCHQPPGNPSGNTVCVAPAAVQNWLNNGHGHYGPCGLIDPCAD